MILNTRFVVASLIALVVLAAASESSDAAGKIAVTVASGQPELDKTVYLSVGGSYSPAATYAWCFLPDQGLKPNGPVPHGGFINVTPKRTGAWVVRCKITDDEKITYEVGSIQVRTRPTAVPSPTASTSTSTGGGGGRTARAAARAAARVAGDEDKYGLKAMVEHVLEKSNAGKTVDIETVREKVAIVFEKMAAATGYDDTPASITKFEDETIKRITALFPDDEREKLVWSRFAVFLIKGDASVEKSLQTAKSRFEDDFRQLATYQKVWKNVAAVLRKQEVKDPGHFLQQKKTTYEEVQAKYPWLFTPDATVPRTRRPCPLWLLLAI